MTNAILRGKPDAGNPHVRFDEGEVASAKPRRGSLLYKKRMQDRIRARLTGVCLFGLCLPGGAATDGYYWPDWIYDLNPWGTIRYWEGDRVPEDGGTAYFTGKMAGDIMFTRDVTLNGLDFGLVQLYTSGDKSSPTVRADGGSLTLTGDRTFLNADGNASASAGARGPILDLAISGTGQNVFTKHGGASVQANRPLSGFATVAVGGGELVTTGASGNLFASEGTLAVRGGTAKWAPSASGVCAASLPALAYGAQGGCLAWTAPSGGSATLTAPTLAREGAGATLEVAPSGGTSALGSTEKLQVTTPPDAAANGMLDAGLVVRDRTKASAPISFLAYDAEKGLVPCATKAWDAAGETDVAVLSETNTLTQSKKVHSLVLDNSATLKVESGATLTVGDGSRPAGIVFNRQVSLGKDKPLTVQGEGTIDFGASPGVLWASTPKEDGDGSNRAVALKTAVKGASGVTFASREHEDAGKTGMFFLYPGYCQWTGPTCVSGALVWLKDGATFPSGDLHVEGGSGGGGSSVRFEKPQAFAQDVYVSGRGMQARGGAGDGGGALYFMNGSDGSVFSNAVTLTDNAWLENAAGVGVHFLGGVKGPGDLHVKGGTFNFYETNTYGRLEVEGATTFAFHTNATLGAGRVHVAANAALDLSLGDGTATAVTNAFRKEAGATLNLALDHAAPTFGTDAAFDALTLRNFSTLKVGGRVAFGSVSAAGASDEKIGKDSVEASAAGAELVVDNAADGTFALPLADGAGTLAFTKAGAGTLELARAARTNTGATTVAQGTLKLVDDPRFSKSLAYWFDASREEDFEKDASSGVITKWKARGGSSDITALTVKAGAPTWGKAEKVNGLDVVSTRLNGGTSDQLVAEGEKACAHRTLFVVARVNRGVAMGGLIGGYNTDVGQRMNNEGTSWDWGSGSWSIETRDQNQLRRDGADTAALSVDEGRPHILTFYHDRDNWATPKSWAPNEKTRDATLVPALGRYYRWDAKRGFDGDYCEILCFDRILNESETRLVENYLAEKWLGQAVHEEIDRGGHLSAETTLRVAAGATLDLNGCPVTVARLEGSGTITNSSAVAATVTVTGGASFDGAVGGPVTLRVAGDSAVGARFDAGAALSVAGGTVAAGTHVLAPPTDGLAYWCDAGQRDTILLDASGSVTGWLSRVSSSAKGLFNAGDVARKTRPTYGAEALDGRPGIVFPGMTTDASGYRHAAALKADKPSPVQTVLLALVVTETSANVGYWGSFGADCGFRANGSGGTVQAANGGARYGSVGDYVSLDGMVCRDDALTLGNGTVRVLATRLDPANHADMTAFLNDRGSDKNPTGLGYYSTWNGAFEGAVGEVIAYDRALADDEMTRVEQYLVAKWKAAAWTEGHPPAETEPAFAPSAGLTLAGAQGGTLTGDMAFDGTFVIDAQNGTTLEPIVIRGSLALGANARVEVRNLKKLKRGTRHAVLRVEGDVTGEFAAVDGLRGRWIWGRTGNEWHLQSAGMAVIIR